MKHANFNCDDIGIKTYVAFVLWSGLHSVLSLSTLVLVTYLTKEHYDSNASWGFNCSLISFLFNFILLLLVIFAKYKENRDQTRGYVAIWGVWKYFPHCVSVFYTDNLKFAIFLNSYLTISSTAIFKNRIVKIYNKELLQMYFLRYLSHMNLLS